MQALEKDRQHEDRAVECETEQRGDTDTCAELAACQDAEVDHRLLRRELAPQQQHERDGRDDGERRHESRVEPIIALATLQHPLQRADAEREQQNALVVDGLGAFLVLGVMDVDDGHDRGENAERDVDVEDPRPVVVVDDPSA